MLQNAIEDAKAADIAIVFVATDSTEGADRYFILPTAFLSFNSFAGPI
jgi:hypothetical protein